MRKGGSCPNPPTTRAKHRPSIHHRLLLCSSSSSDSLYAMESTVSEDDGGNDMAIKLQINQPITDHAEQKPLGLVPSQNPEEPELKTTPSVSLAVDGHEGQQPSDSLLDKTAATASVDGTDDVKPELNSGDAQAAPASLSCVSTHSSGGAAEPAPITSARSSGGVTLAAPSVSSSPVAGEDKKLQYTLRTNPKRSRRFLDPDYTLELAASSASSPSLSTLIPTVGSASATSPPPVPPPSHTSKKGSLLLSEKARACTECGKQFPSWKALFGHMRCHPERQWRGIQPPTSVAHLRERPLSSLVDHAAAVVATGGKALEEESSAKLRMPGTVSSTSPATFGDQSEYPENAKARGAIYNTSRSLPMTSANTADESDTESIEAAYMNGRETHEFPTSLNHANYAHSVSMQFRPDAVLSENNDISPNDELIEERDMADCLVMLAFAARGKTDECSDGDSAFLDWKNYVKKSSLINLTGAKRPTEIKEIKRNSTFNGELHVQRSFRLVQEGGGDGEIAMFNRFSEADKEKDTSWDQSRTCKFECSTCKKTFRSHQALGGHRASHKKVKGCFARTNSSEDAIVAAPDYQMASSEINTAIVLATSTEAFALENQQLHRFQQHKKIREECEEEDPASSMVMQNTCDQEEHETSPVLTALTKDINVGQFLQFSITCSEKIEEDQNFGMSAPESKHTPHPKLLNQTSSCSSSSSIVAAATSGMGSSTSATVGGSMHVHLLQPQLQQTRIHQCGICSRVFSTGQALGGHKRCHWGGSASTPNDGGLKRSSPLIARQDIEVSGATCALMISGAISERTSESSKKGKQDSSSSFTSSAAAETWMSISASPATTDKERNAELPRVMGIKRGRQESANACEELQRTRPTASACTPEHASIEVNTFRRMGNHEGRRGWIEALQIGSCREEKMTKIIPQDERQLDLNLPAPSDEEEDAEDADQKEWKVERRVHPVLGLRKEAVATAAEGQMDALLSDLPALASTAASSDSQETSR
ncbi:hypothetical protein KP509_07G098000 [Ceratopteris richardii]|uniref:C2H2-type domain-containing protein n=1 Tax=Ceratopteris richardii TaxID=49495 RepID=A0A8T2UL19_CERRI|nr:hypothetical protein KP509_07G098000 [Ceratopteris richardii]